MNARLSAFLFGFLFASVSISTANAENLVDVYRLAVERDPVLQAARYALDAAIEKLPQARAGLLPQVSLSSGRNRTHGEYTFGSSPATERNVTAQNWSLQLAQPLIKFVSQEAVNQAEFIVEQAKAQYSLAEQELGLRVAHAYFDVEVARESIAVVDAQFRAITLQFDAVSKGMALGTNTITERSEAKARLELVRSQQVAARFELESKIAELEKIVGDVPAKLAGLKSSIVPQLPVPNDVTAWIAQAKSDAPAVRIQRSAVQVAEKEVAKNKAAYLPSLELTANYGRNYSSGSNSTPLDYDTRARSAQIGVQLNFPWYQGGAIDSRVRESIALVNQAKAQLEAAQRNAATLARQAFAGVTGGAAQIEALTSAVEAAQAAVFGNQVSTRVGIRTNIDVLNAEQQVFIARRDLIKARYETLLQGLKLKAATGALTVADLEAISSAFLAR